jgi:hypothetical protein
MPRTETPTRSLNCFRVYRLLTFLPKLHTIEDYRRFVGNLLMKERVVTVIEETTASSRFSLYKVKKCGNSIHDPTASVAGRRLSSSTRRSRVASRPSNYGAFKRRLAPGGFTKPAASEQSALPTAPITRSGCPTSAIGVIGDRPAEANVRSLTHPRGLG